MEPQIALVCVDETGEAVVAVHCYSHHSLLSNANYLCASAVSEAPRGNDAKNARLEASLTQEGCRGWSKWYEVVTATRGRFPGLRAVGVATNKKNRSRCALLALAVAARASARVEDGTTSAPDLGDGGEFEQLVARATQLLLQQGDDGADLTAVPEHCKDDAVDDGASSSSTRASRTLQQHDSELSWEPWAEEPPPPAAGPFAWSARATSRLPPSGDAHVEASRGPRAGALSARPPVHFVGSGGSSNALPSPRFGGVICIGAGAPRLQQQCGGSSSGSTSSVSPPGRSDTDWVPPWLRQAAYPAHAMPRPSPYPQRCFGASLPAARKRASDIASDARPAKRPCLASAPQYLPTLPVQVDTPPEGGRKMLLTGDSLMSMSGLDTLLKRRVQEDVGDIDVTFLPIAGAKVKTLTRKIRNGPPYDLICVGLGCNDLINDDMRCKEEFPPQLHNELLAFANVLACKADTSLVMVGGPSHYWQYPPVWDNHIRRMQSTLSAAEIAVVSYEDAAALLTQMELGKDKIHFSTKPLNTARFADAWADWLRKYCDY